MSLSNDYHQLEKLYLQATKNLTDEVLEDCEKWYGIIVALPTHLRVVYTTLLFHQEVMNGGLHQYFFNAFGQFAYRTITDLELISADPQKRILEASIEKVNKENLQQDEFRKRICNRQIPEITNFDDPLGDELNELDMEYYAIPVNLEDHLLEYLVKHNHI